jgi:hypothetical protein
VSSPVDEASAAPDPWSGGPVELDQVVPPSGNMWQAGRQFRLGAARTGLIVWVWASTDVIHLSIAGVRVTSVAWHLSGAGAAPALMRLVRRVRSGMLIGSAAT